MTWSEYKSFIKESGPDFGIASGFILATGLAAEMGDLSRIQQKELVSDKNNEKDFEPLYRTIKLGDIFWYLASIENLFNLPDSIFHKFINSPVVQADADTSGKDPLVMLWDMLSSSSSLYKSVCEGDAINIQYDINDLFSLLLYYAHFYQIDLNKVVDINVAKLKQRLSIGKVSSEQEYQAIKKFIEESGSKELLIEVSKNRAGEYKGLRMTYATKKFGFESGDIVKDFYQCTLKMFLLNEENEEYSINYGTKFRDYMSVKSDLKFMYLKDGELKSIEDIKKFTPVKNNIIKVDKKTRPVLVRKDMVKFDDLLDYINTIK